MNVTIDTNVLIAANARSTHASAKCASLCAQSLLDAQTHHVVLTDTADLVMNEYKTYCNFEGQPGVGDRFFLWFLKNQYSGSAVVRVDIGTGGAETTALLPRQLHSFDPSDHKWLALHLAGGGDEIWNALDSDWAEWGATIEALGICVREVCAEAEENAGAVGELSPLNDEVARA